MDHSDESIQKLKDGDREFVWHPFTQMQEYALEDPVVIEKAKGSWLIDIEGRRYLDGVSSLWVNVHGHRHSVIDNAIKAQIDRVAHSTLLGLANVPAIELAMKLNEIAPKGLRKVFYSDNGSSSVEIALKMAFQYFQHRRGSTCGKTGFIALANAYHGDTIGSVSVGGIPLFHELFRPLLFPCTFAPSPYCYRCPLDKSYPACGLACTDALETIVKEVHQETAGLIVEPLVQGAAGILVAPEGYLRRVREICNRYNLLMIADEVATGFGRTGTLFACEQEGVAPDLLCLAKGITGGTLPLAATLATDRIFSAFLGAHAELKTFFHGHTYTGNPLACAAALASISLFESEDFFSRLRARIDFLEKELASLKRLTHVGEIRQKGMMVGIELVQNRETKEPYALEEKIGHRVILAARSRGLILRPLGNVIVLMPPLSMSKVDLSSLVSITAEAIAQVTEP
ncbi:MAG: adenosylmethionine--8-amino-7-oxononanoate transaminase [bacterium]|nr:adenosylmethionine--8-amino-7-oxononanoate transaminase [bacterium]